MRVRSTVRWRLTVLYGGLFLLSGLVLLGVSYSIVRASIEDELNRERDQVMVDLVEAGADPEITEQISEFRLANGLTVAENIAQSARDVRSNALDDLLLAYAIALPITVVLSLLLGWWAAGRALAPVARLTTTAQQLSERNLDQRIALDGPKDELKELADTLDAMLARLDGAFQSQRRFAADVSHEIRTPLAIIKAEAEVTLGDGLSTQRERRLARAVLEATDRAEALITSLLALGRSESTMLSHSVVDLAELAGDVVGDRVEAADAAGVQLDLDLGTGVVEGDPFLLEGLVANLVDNGITHNLDAGGWLRVSVDTVGGSVVVEVENSGPSMTAADVERIAQPFQRLRDDRPGFGLGMAIVRSVATAHDGAVHLRPRAEGGLSVTVELPGRDHRRAPLPEPVDLPV
jgi:signal transduction histidine kinase